MDILILSAYIGSISSVIIITISYLSRLARHEPVAVISNDVNNQTIDDKNTEGTEGDRETSENEDIEDIEETGKEQCVEEHLLYNYCHSVEDNVNTLSLEVATIKCEMHKLGEKIDQLINQMANDSKQKERIDRTMVFELIENNPLITK